MITLTKQSDEGDLEVYHYSPTEEDGVEGYIVKPKGDGPFPGVVVIHGGGSSAGKFGVTYGMVFARAGFATIACDYTHNNLTKDKSKRVYAEGAGPGASPENIRRALKNVSYLQALDFVDPHKIAVWGNSLGGFLTIGVLASGPKAGAIRAAAASSGAVSPKKGLESQKNKGTIQRAAIPPEQAANIQCQVLILHGEKDPVCPIESALELQKVLDEHGKPYRLKIYENEGHGIKNLDGFFDPIIEFFKETLGAAV